MQVNYLLNVDFMYCTVQVEVHASKSEPMRDTGGSTREKRTESKGATEPMHGSDPLVKMESKGEFWLAGVLYLLCRVVGAEGRIFKNSAATYSTTVRSCRGGLTSAFMSSVRLILGQTHKQINTRCLYIFFAKCESTSLTVVQGKY